MSEKPELVKPEPGPFWVAMLRDWGLAILLVVGVFLAYNTLMRPALPALGPAPNFTLPDLKGQQITLSEVDRGVVILNFWFTTCPPCRAEIPELSRFHAEHPEIPMYGISTDVNLKLSQLSAASDRLGISYPVLHDARAEVAHLYGVNIFPTTLIISNGQIVKARVGAVDRKSLLAMVEAAR